jgi:hypothetical protein
MHLLVIPKHSPVWFTEWLDTWAPTTNSMAFIAPIQVLCDQWNEVERCRIAATCLIWPEENSSKWNGNSCGKAGSTVSILLCPRVQKLHHIQSLHPPGHPVTAECQRQKGEDNCSSLLNILQERTSRSVGSRCDRILHSPKKRRWRLFTAEWWKLLVGHTWML